MNSRTALAIERRGEQRRNFPQLALVMRLDNC
jgi:hypothetical protein